MNTMNWGPPPGRRKCREGSLHAAALPRSGGGRSSAVVHHVIVRPMNRTVSIALLLVTLAAQACLADLPRTPIRRTPQLFGQEIKAFVLTATVTIDRSKNGGWYGDFLGVTLSPGRLVPVSEDAEGFFYQATRGIHNITYYHLAHGGIYVSKLFPNRIWVFKGDARVGAKSGIRKDYMPLAPDERRQFRAEEARAKP
jgi:hypothetical protein